MVHWTSSSLLSPPAAAGVSPSTARHSGPQAARKRRVAATSCTRRICAPAWAARAAAARLEIDLLRRFMELRHE